MFQAMNVHHQAISCRTQASSYKVMSKFMWYYSERSMCFI